MIVWPVGVQLAEDLPQREPALRVEPRGRLVEEQDRRPVEDRPRDHQPLGHPARQREHRRLRPSWRAGTARAAVRGGGATRPRRSRTDVPWKYRFSHTVSCRSSVFCCDTTPISCLASAGWATTSTVPSRALPEVGITRVVSIPAVVVLPAPLGPRRPKISPARDRQVEPVDGREVGARVDLGQVDGADDRRRRAVLAGVRERVRFGRVHGGTPIIADRL